VADARVADSADVRRRLDAVRARHGEVLLVVSPPRTASTALARILWNHERVGWYSHEPFEATWYQGAGPESAAALLEAPEPVAELGGRGTGEALVVKEMTFQAGGAFPLLASLATRPLVFLIRDPRLCVASRMRVLEASGRPPVFPLRESGWEDLARQLEHVRREGIEHAIVDSGDLRADPVAVVPPLLARLGLAYDPSLLTWGASQATGLSSVSGAEDPFYQQVLQSRGLEPDTEPMPALDDFPPDGGFRDHVAACVELYEELRRSGSP
jgi:Sulfotransferase domain